MHFYSFFFLFFFVVVVVVFFFFFFVNVFIGVEFWYEYFSLRFGKPSVGQKVKVSHSLIAAGEVSTVSWTQRRSHFLSFRGLILSFAPIWLTERVSCRSHDLPATFCTITESF